EGDMKIKPGMIVGIPRFNGQSVFNGPSVLETIAQKSEKPSKQTEKQAAAKKHVKVVTQASIDKPDKPEELEVKTYHVVKKGETLSSISSRYGVDMSSLRTANNMKSNKVYPNMKLKLVSYSNKKEKTSVKIHVVKKGESLASISTKYGIDVSYLRATNNLKNDKVYPRMKLKIVESKG
ncbi:MAG: LysM peptidoglycan-binding domain-containing protein, partial [Deltaproteobacteria bacterium]